MNKMEQTAEETLARHGDSTKQALILAGLKLFGEYGFKATSTRMLADESGANVAAIPYHFGGKEGLYIAVMEYINERVDAFLTDNRGDIEKALASKTLDQKQAREMLLSLLNNAAQMFVDSDEPKAWAQIIMREQVAPSDAFDVFYDGQMKQTQIMATTLLATCMGINPKSDQAKIRVHALLGQILSFTISRESLLRHLGAKTFKADHVMLIHDVLRSHAEACLGIELKGAP